MGLSDGEYLVEICEAAWPVNACGCVHPMLKPGKCAWLFGMFSSSRGSELTMSACSIVASNSFIATPLVVSSCSKLFERLVKSRVGPVAGA